MPAVLAMVEHWLGLLERGDFQFNPLRSEAAPVLLVEKA
jgi:hypothetical protein